MLENLAILLGLVCVGIGLGLAFGRVLWNRSKEIQSLIRTRDTERMVLTEERAAAEAERDVSDLKVRKLQKALAVSQGAAKQYERLAAIARAEKAAAEEKLGDEELRITALEAKIDEFRQSAVADQQAEMDALVDAKVKAQNALADEMAKARQREENLRAEIATAKTQAGSTEQLANELAEMKKRASMAASLQSAMAEKDERIRDLEAQMRSVAEASSELDSVLANLAVRDKLVADLRARAAPGSNAASGPNPVASNAPGSAKPTNRPPRLPSAREGQPDNLKCIKGITPELETELQKLGIFHFDQIAAWSEDDLTWIDQQLEKFGTEASRAQWISQAKILAAGGETPFSARIAEEDIYRSA